ncbi:MAG: hypothetical protein ETSY1_46335 (plasmid) [Candidatus Entotheonella factor]|uniref:Ferritin-like domain-containing protein n=1 Tax=Entotheonella factor TaxID=1429438 RepID=W4M0L6_ENTF1|nr:MAG: hypothetical protein ETSY1_46335 [Candidatus Entotheonella factor]
MTLTLTFHQMLNRLEEMAHLHRSMTQVLAGWNPKMPDLKVKLGCARHAYEHMQQAAKLEQQIAALTRTNAAIPDLLAVTRAAMQSLDARPCPTEVLTGLYKIVLPTLTQLYRDTLAALHPTCDFGTLGLLQPYEGVLAEQRMWGEAMVRHHGGTTTPYLQALQSALESRYVGPRCQRQEWLWAPLDRVSEAVRPDFLKRAIPGAMRLTPVDRWEDLKGIGLAMHNQLHGEYTTMELTSRNLYEHPEMPTKFHLDMARQAADEARHAIMFEELAEAYGVRIDDYPTYTLTYDGYYAYPEMCEPNSQKELLWRLLIRGTVDEGLALDDLLFQINMRQLLQQDDIVARLHYVLVDETFHVQAALHWVRYLCAGDQARVMDEREVARQYVDTLLRKRRHLYEQMYPDEVAQELSTQQRLRAAIAKRPPLPFERYLNIEHRKLSGYADEELDQVVQWGYGQPPPANPVEEAV